MNLDANTVGPGLGAESLRVCKRPCVSIIIPCRNEKAGIVRCVQGAVAQQLPEIDLEVIVVDGASDDGTAEVLQQLANADPKVRVLTNARRIVSVAMNLGVRAARGDVILRMDAHTEYATDYVKECLDAMARTGAENVGGPARTLAVSYWERVIAAAYHSPFAVGGARFHDVEFEGYVDTVPYGCWSRGTLDRYGLFDEELVRNQDDEHNLRIVRGGGRIWQSPRIRSWYRPRGSLGALYRQYCQYGYWKVWVIRKHRLPASWRHLVPGAFVLALAVLPSASLALWLARITVAGPAFGDSVERSLELGAVSLLAVWVAMVGLYGLASCATAAIAGFRGAGAACFGMPLAFAHYHFGYGCGFLYGLWDVWFRRGTARESFGRLTR